MKNLIQSIVLIAVLMSTTGAEEVIYAVVGDTVTLKQSGISEKQHYVNWIFGSLHLAWRNPMGGKVIQEGLPEAWKDKLSVHDDSLIIKNIQKENFGTFICNVDETKPSTTTTTTTTYKVLKHSVSFHPNSPLLRGESLTLSCDAETHQGHKPKIHWLNPNGKNSGANGKLIVSVTSQDNGVWTCVVTYDKKESKARISVLVVDLSPAPLHKYTSKSSPLTIPCSIPPHISWEQIKAKGGQEVHWQFFPNPSWSLISEDPQRLFSLSLENSTWKVDQDRGLSPVPNLDKGNLSLTRKRATEEDRGAYVCSLKFKNGVTLNRTINVEVLEIIPSPGTELISGQWVNLTCSTGHVLPSDIQVKWVLPQQSSLQSLPSDHHSAHLTIPEVGKGDGGKWRCELWQNNARLTSAMIMLKIEPKLNVWMLVTICGATVIVILICILVLILNRRRQRKRRHLRHRLCQCKNPKPKGFYRT